MVAADPPPLRAGRGPGARRLDPLLEVRVRPISPSLHQCVPVPRPLRPLFPGGGLQRGTVVVVERAVGATSLVLALVGSAIAGGAWAAVIGLATLGMVAAAEQGVDLHRLVLVPDPGDRPAEVAATLLDGADIVVMGTMAVGVTMARRLAARVRERRAVLLVACGARRWPEGADLHLSVESTPWEGMAHGYGTLRRRWVAVSASGRRATTVQRRVELWLPDAHGRAAAG